MLCTWMAVLVLCLLSFGVTAAFANVQRTVMLTDLPDVASGDAMIAALVFALLVSIGASRSLGGSVTQIILRSIASAGILFMMLLVPLIVTSHQIVEAWAFSGRTQRSVQTFQIDDVRAYQGKGGWHYDASINPLRCKSCMPTIPIKGETYQFIIDRGGDQPRSQNSQNSRTNLCMTFNVEGAGRSERILVDRAAWTASDIKRCPSGIN